MPSPATALLLLVAATIGTATTHALPAEDVPTSCANPVPLLDSLGRSQMAARVRTAHQYYMNSTDASAGRTLEERTANFDRAAADLFRTLRRERTARYEATVCDYKGVDWNQGGRSSWKTLSVEPGFYLVTSTLERTTNGDWKGGPEWGGDPSFPTSIRWKTGGHRRSETFVNIKARYLTAHITEQVRAELTSVREELARLGIPTGSLPTM